MASAATHIKFALDVKEKYKPKNISKYLCGAIYPDSRYITGINRNLTHGKQKLNKTDFQKGWQTHLICDELWHKFIYDKFPELNLDINSQDQDKDKDWWVSISAIKVIQDALVLKKFDIHSYLSLLNYAENPNDEDFEKIKQFNELIRKIYGEKKEFSFEDTLEIWPMLGVSEELVHKISKRVQELSKNSAILKRISGIYDRMIDIFLGK